jgi:hypothetical protein
VSAHTHIWLTTLGTVCTVNHREESDGKVIFICLPVRLSFVRFDLGFMLIDQQHGCGHSQTDNMACRDLKLVEAPLGVPGEIAQIT